MTPFELQQLMADLQTAHSDLQIDRFILMANGLTEYGCYKQALRELHTRLQTMLGYWLELETLECDEEDLGAIDTRRQQLELAKIRLRRMNINEGFSESRREFLRFLGHAQYLKGRIGELTPERRAEFEREFWIENIKRMGPDQGMRLAQMMGTDARQQILGFAPKDLPELPEPSAELDIDEMLKLTVERKLLSCQEPS